MRRISSAQISAGTSPADSLLAVNANGNPAFRSFANYVLDDVSPQFDGIKTVFGLTLDTANISTVINNSIVDSKDVDVAINGSVLMPYVRQLTWPWITPFDSFRGYRVVDDNIISCPHYDFMGDWMRIAFETHNKRTSHLEPFTT